MPVSLKIMVLAQHNFKVIMRNFTRKFQGNEKKCQVSKALEALALLE
jgi:hypothetical protein